MMKNALSLFIFVVVIALLFLPSYSKLQELRQKNEDFAKRIQYLELKNKQLEDERQHLLHNPDYLEKVAREKMGLIRQGETVYKIVPAEKKKK